MSTVNVYGDISPRTAAFAATEMLARALPALCAARFGQQVAIPKNRSTSIKLRRYNAFAPSTNPLVEGVTPTAEQMTNTDVFAQLQQYGRRTSLTDVILDTHEDNVLAEYSQIMGELAGQTMEMVVFNVIRAGTNVLFQGSGGRGTVNARIDAVILNRAIRQLKRQNAMMVTTMLQGTDKVGTMPIRAAFVAFCHPDLENDLEAVTGYKTLVEYSQVKPLADNELGAYRNVRFLASTLYAPWLKAGNATYGTPLLSNGATGTSGGTDNADVYPVIIVGKDAYGTVSLAGNTAVTPMVVNPKPSDSDPMAQRGHIAFKFYATAVILNDAWMVRLEVGVNA
jgi:N4-gp56 family major capsid protein